MGSKKIEIKIDSELWESYEQSVEKLEMKVEDDLKEWIESAISETIRCSFPDASDASGAVQLQYL